MDAQFEQVQAANGSCTWGRQAQEWEAAIARWSGEVLKR
jgi:hypothetical protein